VIVVRSVTPIHVTDAELARRQQRYRRLSPPGIEVRLADLGAGDVPRTLDTAADVERSEQCVAQHLSQTDSGTYDYFLPDCVLDPCIDQPDAPVPVLGLLRLTTFALAGAGHSFDVAARNEAIAEGLRERLHRYGLPGRAFSLGLQIGHVTEGDAWVGRLRRASSSRAVDSIVNGCSAVDLPARDGGSPTVVDPIATALRVLSAIDWNAADQRRRRA
jgi:hypothetical protein